MLLKSLTALLALLYLGNGSHMLWDPAGWYDGIPGITASGPMNAHFIRDIGFIYALSGVAYFAALWRWPRRAAWLALGAAWPTLHALFHLAEWATHGLPPGAALAAEGLGVVAPAAVGIVIAGLAQRAPRAR